MQCVSTRTTVSIFLYFRRDKALQSEPAPQLYSRLHRPSFLHKSVPHTLKIERSILFVQCIAHPEINLPMSFLETDASVQRAVEGLAYAVLFGPVDASGTGVVGIQLDAVQPVPRTDAEDVLTAHVHGMLGNKGYVLAVVADLLKLPIHFLVGDVILKGGIGITITCIQREVRSNGSRQGNLCPLAAAFAGICRFASQSAWGEA